MVNLQEAALAACLPADAVTDDAFLSGRLMLLQPRKGYRAGLDAVLLAAAAPVEDAMQHGRALRVLDAGSGVGAVGLCLARRIPGAHVTLVERDAQLAALARANVKRNDLAARVAVVKADLTLPLASVPELANSAETFDLVLSNPPYYDEGFGTPAPDALKAVSHAMPAGHLDRWMRFVASMVRPDGLFALINRAQALDAVLAAAARRFGALRVRPFLPREGADASRIIVEGRKGSRAPLSLAASRILHDADGRYREDIEAVLRDGAALAPFSA
ncbi:MAG: methyltransferase domain-containing protein [Hyphomicrobiales bacterium]|nr:MAG: methyltransferase domain-containing protein [Hyphomicrobiales bacterium]